MSQGLWRAHRRSDPDRQTAEIQIRIALVNRLSSLGSAEIVRIARGQGRRVTHASDVRSATCVTAPCARGILGAGLGASRVPTCVRPRTRPSPCREPVWYAQFGPRSKPRTPRVQESDRGRAILFASATRTSIGGFRVSIPPSHVPCRAEAWTCRLMTTLLAPMISGRPRGSPQAAVGSDSGGSLAPVMNATASDIV